jgi:hypothetical protein
MRRRAMSTSSVSLFVMLMLVVVFVIPDVVDGICFNTYRLASNASFPVAVRVEPQFNSSISRV